MPNSIAAVSANRPPRTAGQRGSDRLVGEELLTGDALRETCEHRRADFHANCTVTITVCNCPFNNCGLPSVTVTVTVTLRT